MHLEALTTPLLEVDHAHPRQPVEGQLAACVLDGSVVIGFVDTSVLG